ncbi:MAG: glycogen synthase GlgA [Planctomycetes bacterium]|nr:glycogen synthase GlgA [Planctomycetota bacterium]
MKILFATSEAYPLSKTGGLGDVCGSLPSALQALGDDVRVALPAYQHALERVTGGVREVAALTVPGHDQPVRVLETLLPERAVPVYLISAPALFDDRPGTPYHDPDGREWPDNALRFAVYSRAVAALALGQAGLGWTPDLVHGHDWTAGLVPALLAQHERRPATVFTVHNLAHQGLYPRETFDQLGLPPAWWALDGLEFYGQLSFIKGGLVFADWLTTVSPNYAREICRPDMGCGIDGLLRHRRDRLVGVLNGADYDVWDPSNDPLITRPYGPDTLARKAENKRALQRLFGFAEAPGTPLIAHISRLVPQKGTDLLIETIPRLMSEQVQMVVLGRGEPRFAQALTDLAARYPRQLAAYVGYSEELAHRMTAGADMFCMPSRFEPCGLNQIYSLRYGTVPIVRRTGGLADTVVDASAEAVASDAATGFQFEQATSHALLEALRRALRTYGQDAKTWRQLVAAGMRQDFSWERGARAYQALYRQALQPPAQPEPAPRSRPSARVRREASGRLPRETSGRVPLPPPVAKV